MAVSVSLIAIITTLYIIAIVFAIAAERRRSTAGLQIFHSEYLYCEYSSNVSTAYGWSAFSLVLLSQIVLNGVTKCRPCFGRGLFTGSSTPRTVFLFVFSWISFLGAEAFLMAGSVRNAYRTNDEVIYGEADLTCDTLPKGVFAAGAALTMLSLLGSTLHYWSHSTADTRERQQNEIAMI